MSGEDDGEKQFEASQKRLDDMRRQGRIARSPEALAAAATAGLMLAVLALGPQALRAGGAAAARFLEMPDRLAQMQAGGAAAPVWGLTGGILLAAAPFLLLPGVLVLAVLIATRGIVLTPDNLLPKLSRISPIAGISQRLGLRGLVDFGRNTLKMLLIGAILGWFLWGNLDPLIGLVYLDPGPGVVALLQMAQRLLVLMLLISVAIALPDLLWQRIRHLRDARMTRQEMIEEHKDSEGDPHMRQHRRQKGQNIAMNRMLRDVDTADVVVVNPTHYAVALKWDRGSRRAPVCVAKGVDEIAARIRERAKAAGVPIHRDPPTARALHAAIGLGQEIGRDHYKAVAAAIRFAEAMRRKARAK